MTQMQAPACVVSHGGAANRPDVVDGCAAANAAALTALAGGARLLDAVVAAVVVLEDDPRMNAGTGSVLRLGADPKTGSAQMDASVMDARGFGAVAVVEGLKNPVRLARAIYDSPHMLLAGAGAAELADRLGLERADVVTEAQREKHARRLAQLESDPSFAALWRGADDRLWRGAVWRTAPALGGACDTVGVVARDDRGAFAAAASTGGLWCALRGRVGDVPIPGAGLYVGEAGAVAATGVGEIIWREMLSLRCYDRIAAGEPAQAAIDAVIARVRAEHPDADIGLIAVDTIGSGGGVTREMPWQSTTT